MSEWFQEKSVLLFQNEWLWESNQSERERECQAHHDVVINKDILSQLNLETELYQQEKSNKSRVKTLGAEWLQPSTKTSLNDSDSTTTSSNYAVVPSMTILYGQEFTMLSLSKLLNKYVFGETNTSLVVNDSDWPILDKVLMSSTFCVSAVSPKKVARRLKRNTRIEDDRLYINHAGRELRLYRSELRKGECEHGEIEEDASHLEKFLKSIFRSKCKQCECNGKFLMDMMMYALQFPQDRPLKPFCVTKSLVYSVTMKTITIINHRKELIFVNSVTEDLELENNDGIKTNIKIMASHKVQVNYEMKGGLGLGKIKFSTVPFTSKNMKKLMEAVKDDEKDDDEEEQVYENPEDVDTL